MSKPTRESEHDIQTAIRLAASEYENLTLWRNSTGVTMEEERKRRYGLCVGSADLIGVLRVPIPGEETLCVEPGDPHVCLGHQKYIGRFIACEVKRPGEDARPDQVLFLNLVRSMGGFAFVAHSVDEFRAGVDRAMAGEDQ